jgi:hypothetical protein
MPYKSKKQAAYMHIHHPDIAKKWDEEGAKVEEMSMREIFSTGAELSEEEEKTCPSCEEDNHHRCRDAWCACCKGNSKTPKMESVFRIKESPFTNLAQQSKVARPVAPSTVTQNAGEVAKNTRQTLQGVAKTQGTIVKQSPTDPQNPIPNTFVQKPDGSTDVLDPTTGQLKPVQATGQNKPSQPMQNTGVMGT